MSDPTTNGMLIAAITALAGVVTFLWKQLYSNHIECKEDRKALWNEVLKCNERHDHASNLKNVSGNQ